MKNGITRYGYNSNNTMPFMQNKNVKKIGQADAPAAKWLRLQGVGLDKNRRNFR